jgi:S-adenosylmethionine decarboxylase
MKTPRYHLITDISDADPAILNDATGLSKFLETLPGLIDMHILYGPVVKEGIPENPGLSGFVIIDYSHISIHTFTKHNEALVDVFSCKPFEQEVAKQAICQYFQVDSEKVRERAVYWGN